MAFEPFQTAEAQGTPTVRQQSVFVENRVGQLLRLTQLVYRADIRILAVSIVHSFDCAIARMILDQPDEAYDTITQAGFKVSEAEIIVISLPHGKRGLLDIWTALLGAEISIHYTYPLLVRPQGRAAIAVLPDNIEQAVQILREQKLDVLDQGDLFEGRYE